MQSKKNHNIKDIKITFEDESAKKLASIENGIEKNY